MRSYPSKRAHQATLFSVAALLVSSVSCQQGGRTATPKTAVHAPRRSSPGSITISGTTTVSLTAQSEKLTLRDGTTTAPMWGYCYGTSCTAGSAWAPGPTIVVNKGDTLTVNLTNNLAVPTSLVVLGQLGGGLGAPSKMASPPHAGQDFTTFVGNGSTTPRFTPPAQDQGRVSSFGTEVPAGGNATLTYPNLRPGTYIYETGTLPSLQVPMGLYGVLVVKGEAYTYDDDTALLFSEVDLAQNAAVDAAAQAGTDMKANYRFNDPDTTHCHGGFCYPAAVNYSPTYFLINGDYFDKTSPANSAFKIADTATVSSGLLVRLLNAGSRTHVPSIVGLPMALVAEDGNPAPGNPKVQSEVLLTAGKTYDAIVKPAANGTIYASATYPVFDRQLSLSSGNHLDGGMQGFLLINHAAAPATGTTCKLSPATPCAANTDCTVAGDSCVFVPVAGAPGNLPALVTPTAVNDSFNVPYNTTLSDNVTTNDIGVVSVALGTGPANGTLTLNPDGSFTYAPNAGFTGTDTFTYSGNSGAAGTATVTLNVAKAGIGAAPTAGDDSFTSNVATKFSVPRPGVLANDSDPNGYPLTAGSATLVTDSTTGPSCALPTLNPDGSFSMTGSSASTCKFTYLATNSQGTPSNAATVTVTFGAASKLQVNVVGAHTGAISDYRWTIQEDLTFKHDVSVTQPASARTVGTSFHRSHMPVVAAGCVGDISCGSSQTSRGGAVTRAPDSPPGDVVLDPLKNYYISILPGDAAAPVVSGGACPDPSFQQTNPNAPNYCDPAGIGHQMGGAEIKPGQLSVTIKVQEAPLTPAQMSIYIYEDNQPTNGQNEPVENPLGGFNVILLDPAGRTGDPAGQQTYDAFNMPLSNYLLGRPGCPDTLNASTNGTGTSAVGNAVGLVYTCPNDPNFGTPAADALKYALAGHALIRNLTPGRYDVIAHPGAAREGAGEVWWQTETLEGTAAQDAFTGINEPGYFQEFGPPGPHVTIGFVNPNNVALSGAAIGVGATGTSSITGQVTSQHMSHPSDVTLWDSNSYDVLFSTTCQVVVNSQAGDGPAIAAAQCNPDGSFAVSGIPAGDYDVAIFDQWLDQIIQNVAVTVPANTPVVALGNIPVLSWFTQYDQYIYQDLNGNGKMDPGEPGISNVPLTVRFRNGAPSNTTLSDSNGNGILVELFPLFNWYVAEADTTRFKQTGVHIYVDGGGKPDTTGTGANLWASSYAYPADNNPITGTTERTEIPGALTYGLQSFISQRNRVEWGRAPYLPGENGGIVGTVVYSSTRPFDDMRFNVQTIWEPLVPRVPVNLYRKETLADGTSTLTLVDTTTTSSWDDYVNLVQGLNGNTVVGNYLIGTDGQLRDPTSGAVVPGLTAGAQVNMQCPGQAPLDPFVNFTLGANDRQRCYDGWHDWNQVQAAPYDGRYTFPTSACLTHKLSNGQPACAANTLVDPSTNKPSTIGLVLPPGTYVVEAVTPPGYEIVKEEDKNILIGDAFVAPATQQFGPLASIFILPDQATIGNGNPYNPNTGDPGFQSNPTTDLGVPTPDSNSATFPPCVGNLHRVPDFLSLYPQAAQVAPFAGSDRPLCDRKQIALNDQMQGSATFFVYTEVPVASNNTGIILDDASSEFNAVAPDFGEKASVPFVPVSMKDFTGNEISRTYSDQWGAYNLMTPSSWLVNPPTPSGYGPNMLVSCINDPGPISDGKGGLITDPHYNPAYSNFCYTNPYMPGQTTYLDTPVLPVAAFAAGYNPVDCALPDSSPAIKEVESSASQGGPYLTTAGGTLTITAPGDLQVPNPAYAGPFAAGSTQTITRHYGFGSATGRLKIGDLDLTSFIPAGGWTDGSITVNVPAHTPTGELSITTASGQTTVDAVTVTVEDTPPTYVSPSSSFLPGMGPIQTAIDAAKPGALIMLMAGTYNELVIMWKPVRLQGVGAGSVIINAAKYPTSKLDAWRPRINQLFNVDPITGNQTLPSQVDPLTTQEITGGVVLLEPTVLGSEEGAGITVLAKNLPATACNDPSQVGWDSNFLCYSSRIDGISVTGGDAGGGIYVNGWAHYLEISNNRVYGNAGAYNGGVRVGVPYLELESLPAASAGQRIPGFGFDVGMKIHHNSITKNGTVEAPAGNGGAGGGVSICTGTDNYSVDHNYVCGNFSGSDGAGIGHLGFSQGGRIAYNQVLFNQSFQQTSSTHGGGIFVGGEPAIAGTVSLGAGDLTIDANLIRGNFAEGGQGGGIRLQQVNGADVSTFSGSPVQWNKVTVTNNMIVNNVAGWAGGGISMADTLNASIVNNTVSSNDSAGIAGVVLAGGVALPGATTGQAGIGYASPSGIVTEKTSAALLNSMAAGLRSANAISQPELENNIIWQNRSFYYSGNDTLCPSNNTADTVAGCAPLANQSATGQCVSGAKYWEIGVLGDASATPGAARLNPTYSIMSSIGGYPGAGNKTADPVLVNPYCNGSRVTPEFGGVINPPSVLNLQVAATVDEGNNYVNMRYGPLSVVNPATLVAFGDYHLGGAIGSGQLITGSTSPAFDSGIATDAPNHDFDGQYRPIGKAFDIGADEFLIVSPIMVVSPNPVAFGNVSINTNKTTTITVSNAAAATGALLLAAPSLPVPPPASVGNSVSKYSLSSACPVGAPGLAPGASCTISVTFAPTAINPNLQTATLNVNASNAPTTSVPLSGTGVVPFYTITPEVSDFGNQQVGTSSAPLRLTLTNTVLSSGGELWLTGNPTPATGQFVAAFRPGDTCTAATHLATGATCTFSVVFTPTSPGFKSTFVNVTHVAGATGLPAFVAGTGVAPSASRSPATLAFGNVQVGSSAASQPVTLTNTGVGPLSFTSVTFTGTNNGDFTQTNNCGASLAVGAFCIINVRFTPSSTGARTVTMRITDAAPAAAQTVALTGTGVAPNPGLGTGTFNFGGGATTRTSTFALTNTGATAAPFVITALGAGKTGAGPGTYTIVPSAVPALDCAVGKTIAVGGSCTASVRFVPNSATVTTTGSLSVTGTPVGSASPTYTATRSLTGS